MEPTGYYWADYMSSIYEPTFVGNIRSRFHGRTYMELARPHMIPLRACGITGFTQWTVHYIKEQGKEMHAYIVTVHTHVA